ncbi:CU044_2847 family protein [Allostreptomyces psammosilenae]|uniref:Trypsin-co-occurring domain-containing protein n=1 Tax=Allostreptomyces psammosilenae TaxID=1892865 RepID=A0A852ZU04_9ACTN|nr:CU044_2847 family protein [Allostreptomyces psammosilenae]NYI05876.1 hypothetical protein [Allostreptomyces psammosilenae]
MAEGTQLIRVPLDGAGPGAGAAGEGAGEVVMEVDAVSTGLTRVSRPGEIAATAARSLGESFTTVRAAAVAVFDRLATLPERPDTIELEVGVKISAEAGAVITRTAGEGNFVLRLTWQKPPADGPATQPPAAEAPTTDGPAAGDATG